MGQLTEDMARLRQNINDSRDSRGKDCVERTASVNTMIAGFASTRSNQAPADAQSREAFVSLNTSSVADLLDNFSNDHQSMARQGREERASFESERTAQARVSSQERNRFIASLVENVSSQLDSFHQAHSEMAKSTSEDRAAFVSNLASSVATLIHEVASERASANAAFFGGGVKSEKKNEIPKVVVSQSKASRDKPAVRETLEAQVDAVNEPSNVQPEALQPFDQPPLVAETVQDTPEPATLWDSLVVKEGKSGDHEKPKKKHHGTAGEENRDSKQDGS